MASVKAIMNCIGAETSGSVLRHLFGFRASRVPQDPGAATAASVSMLSHIRGLQGRHIHLNLIRVGWDQITGATNQANIREKLDYAVYRTRTIYAQRDLGVGRVLYYTIDAADANGADDLGSSDEADELSDDWGVPNNGIDVFIVRNISASGDDGFIGISPVDGDCDKGGKDDGLIGGAINRGGLGVGANAWDGFARTFAHEIGHYLGLSHNHGGRPDCPDTTNGCNNLMAQTRCANNCGGGVRAATRLTSGQGSTMRDHCMVRSGC